MIQEREIRERLAAMLSGRVSLAAFGEWLASESWNMFADGSSETIALVAAINIRIDAYDDGALNPSSLRRELLALLNAVETTADLVEHSVVAPIVRPVTAAQRLNKYVVQPSADQSAPLVKPPTASSQHSRQLAPWALKYA